MDKFLADHLWVDSHVIATPILADIDGDGDSELIVPVTYYFDLFGGGGVVLIYILTSILGGTQKAVHRVVKQMTGGINIIIL